jgi:4-hydroxy-L-threonine phosphate dehydrogenase PdxA
MNSTFKPNIAILLGDPSGVGPELACRLLNDSIIKEANIIVIGEKSILEDGERVSKVKTNLTTVKNFEEINFNEGSGFFIDLTNGIWS